MAASDSPQNPYISGRPIGEHEPDLFFGRNDLFQFIEDNLVQGERVILLHGQRRIGKSSVLGQMTCRIRLNEFVFVSFSLEGESQKPLPVVLHDLAQETIDELGLEGQVNLPSEDELVENEQIFSDDFLPEIRAAIDGKELVLLLDEFDSLGDYNLESAAAKFFPYLLELIYRKKGLFIIPVIGRRLDDLPKLTSLFKGAPSQEIGLLRPADAKELIQKPAEGVLDYESNATDTILELCSGHPYCTQTLCSAIFRQARENQKWQVSRSDVEQIINQAFQDGEGGLVWFWDGIPAVEKIVLLTIAETQQKKLLEIAKFDSEMQNVEVVEGEPLKLLEEYGVELSNSFHYAEENLLNWKYLKQTGQDIQDETIGAKRKYRIAVEFVRRWLLNRYALRSQIWDLLHGLNPDLEHTYEQAKQVHQSGDRRDAIRLYEEILTTNPNYFKALFKLIPAYKEEKDFEKFARTYERAVKVDHDRIPSDTSKQLIPLEKAELQEGIKAGASQEVAKLELVTRSDTRRWKWRTVWVGLLAIAGLILGIFALFDRTSNQVEACPIGQGRIGDSNICGVPLPQKPFSGFKDIPNVPQQIVRYGGSTSFAPLRNPTIEAQLERYHPGFKLAYVDPPTGTPGSASGVRLLLEGQISVAQSSEPLIAESFDIAKSRGFTLEQVPVAYDGIVFYVNSATGISKLTTEELQKILTGEITNWSEIPGGANLEIKLFTRNPQDGGTPEFIQSELMQGKPFANYSTGLARDTTASIRGVSAEPGGIGFASAPEVCNQTNINIKPLAIAKENEFVSVCESGKVNTMAIARSSYSITRRLFVIIKRDGGSSDEQAGLAYANLLLSDEGQRLIQSAGFAPIRPIEQ